MRGCVAPPAEFEMKRGAPRARPLIAFFDYADVFEDFYPHYGVTPQDFAKRWDNSGNHAFLSLVQRDIGDVLWYEFSIKPQVGETRHERVGCRVKFVPSAWLHRQLWRLFYLPKHAWRWRGAYRAYATVASYLAPLSSVFLRCFWRERPDFLFVQDYASGKFDVLSLLASLMGVPLIAYHSGSQPDRYLGSALRRYTLPRAHRIIASGQGELEMLTTRFSVPRECLSVVLTPIDTTLYEPLPRDVACGGTGLDPARRYVLFVGRLDDEMKRISAIIRAFAVLAGKHPQAILLIVGDGSDREMLERAAMESVPDRVRFLGWVKAAEAKARLYASADCLVLASRREGFPTVIGEAMACGTPVISSRVGAVEEMVVEGRTGWLFAPGDDEGLVNALDRALSLTAAEAAEMRARARSMACERVSPEVVTAELRKCFRA
jgi:glycosyltransferase involved in cell wall biosynthesis